MRFTHVDGPAICAGGWSCGLYRCMVISFALQVHGPVV